jgi:hypothetical protein
MINLATASSDELIEYLLVNPSVTDEETGEILLNILGRLSRLEAQNGKQDSAIADNRTSLASFCKSRQKSRAYALRARAAKGTGKM